MSAFLELPMGILYDESIHEPRTWRVSMLPSQIMAFTESIDDPDKTTLYTQGIGTYTIHMDYDKLKELIEKALVT